MIKINNYMRNIFQNVFQKQLILEEPDDQLNYTNDQTAMQQSLDPGTDPGEFDIDASSDSQDALIAAAKAEARMTTQLSKWIEDLEHIVEFLNGTGSGSIQSKLKSALPDTLFDKIAKGENKKITRSAMELSSLKEGLKGYLASTSNASLRGV